MSNMDKEAAIKTFYELNHVDTRRVANPLDPCYDPRLAQLPQKVDQWLENVDAVDRALFLQLLSRYSYLSRVECQLRYGQILYALRKYLALEDLCIEKVLFVTIEAGGAYASGGDNVRADLQYRNLGLIKKQQIVAAQSKLSPEDLKPYRAVLFLDDVLGSGMTMWRAIWQLRTQFPEWFEKQKIFCGTIAPRERGVKRIDRNCRKYGISLVWLYDEAWVQEPAFESDSREYRQLERYEKQIGEYLTEPDKSFFMGFSKNRLLLSFYYNTPNNTLSTFWREGADMKPPFYRDGNQPDRLTLEALKSRKRQMGEQAYNFGTDRRRWKNGG